MMDILVTLSIWLIFNLLNWSSLELLQRKDYLIARVFSDKRIFKINSILILLIFILILQVTLTSPLSDSLLATIVFAALTYTLIKLFRGKLKRGRLTSRAIIILFFANFIFLFTYLFFPKISTIAIIIMTILNLWVLLFVNEIVKYPAYIGHRLTIAKAKRIVESIPDIKTIMITGSYGKTTMKSFLSQMLMQMDFKVLTTTGSINSDIGIAREIIRQTKDQSITELAEYNYLILERDIFKQGSITHLLKYFPIDLAIVTGINEQHQTTLGSLDNAIDTALEVVSGFKQEPKMIINASDPNYLEIKNKLSERDAVSISTYGYAGSTKDKMDASVSNVQQEIKPGAENWQFDLQIAGEAQEIHHNLPGKFNSLNLAGAFLAIRLVTNVRIDYDSLTKSIKLKQRTVAMHLSDGVEIVDDSFSANPASAVADLDLISQRQQVLAASTLWIFTGLIDLGRESEAVHINVGRKLGKLDITTIVTNDVFGWQIEKGLDEKEKIFISENNQHIIEKINEFLAEPIPEDQHKMEVRKRIVITGRIPGQIYNHLKKKLQF